jgi:hypothetical protein
LGVERSEGRGSRVRFGFNGINLFIHKPHPEKELKRYQVKDICDFLESAGVESPQDGE